MPKSAQHWDGSLSDAKEAWWRLHERNRKSPQCHSKMAFPKLLKQAGWELFLVAEINTTHVHSWAGRKRPASILLLINCCSSTFWGQGIGLASPIAGQVTNGVGGSPWLCFLFDQAPPAMGQVGRVWGGCWKGQVCHLYQDRLSNQGQA